MIELKRRNVKKGKSIKIWQGKYKEEDGGKPQNWDTDCSKGQ